MPKPKQFSIPGTKFAKPEKSGRLKWLLFLLFVAAGILASVWLIQQSPKLNPLVCDTESGNGTLTTWGGCHEAE